MSKKIKFTQNQILFQKQQKRLKRIMRQAEKEGVSFRDNELEKILQQPQRVTRQRIETLKELTPKKLITRFGYTVDDETGELLTGGVIYNQYLTKRRAEKVAKDDFSIINIIKAELAALSESKRGEVYIYQGGTGGFILIGEYTNTLSTVFNRIVEANKENRKELAAYLEKHGAEISRGVYVLTNYKGASSVSEAYSQMVAILRGAPNGGVAMSEAYDITNDADIYGEEYDEF